MNALEDYRQHLEQEIADATATAKEHMRLICEEVARLQKDIDSGNPISTRCLLADIAILERSYATRSTSKRAIEALNQIPPV